MLKVNTDVMKIIVIFFISQKRQYRNLKFSSSREFKSKSDPSSIRVQDRDARSVLNVNSNPITDTFNHPSPTNQVVVKVSQSACTICFESKEISFPTIRERKQSTFFRRFSKTYFFVTYLEKTHSTF